MLTTELETAVRKELETYRSARAKTSGKTWVRRSDKAREIEDDTRTELATFGGFSAYPQDLNNAAFAVMAKNTVLPDQVEILLTVAAAEHQARVAAEAELAKLKKMIAEHNRKAQAAAPKAEGKPAEKVKEAKEVATTVATS